MSVTVDVVDDIDANCSNNLRRCIVSLTLAETELSMNEEAEATLTDVTGCKVDCEDGEL